MGHVTTIAAYIDAAPREGQAHLRRLHALLEAVAPEASQVIKWGNPFFVEPRFLFAYSAHKAHLSLSPSREALAAFKGELAPYATTTHFLKIRYDQPLPEALIRRIAEYRLRAVQAREDDGFW